MLNISNSRASVNTSSTSAFAQAVAARAIVNSVVHTDYAQRGAPIRVAVFDDRVEPATSSPIRGQLVALDDRSLDPRASALRMVPCTRSSSLPTSWADQRSTR